jgi:hypothetical protein
MGTNKKKIKVFISYSWDSEEHKEWVLNLAKKLKDEEVTVILDRYSLQKYGMLVPHFIEQSILKSKRVICIMTPNYKKKTEGLEDGVGEEYSIIQAEISNNIKTTKYIPILRRGNKHTSIPIKLQGRLYLDMTEDRDFEDKFIELVRDIQTTKMEKGQNLRILFDLQCTDQL